MAAAIQLGNVVDLSVDLAIEAARHYLPLADRIIYATAVLGSATLWTQDAHFASLSDVRDFAKS